MENKNRNLWIWIVVVVIVLIGVVMWATNSSAPTVTNNNTPTADQTNALEVQSTEDLSIGSVDVGAPAASLSYSQALVKYKDARLQLDKVCQASPDKMTFKNNALLMVDNRAPVARTVRVGSVFPIKAYGFKIVKLTSTTLPVTWKVDCDASQNVSSILIEK
jgi:cytoskeletal protein RodZ